MITTILFASKPFKTFWLSCQKTFELKHSCQRTSNETLLPTHQHMTLVSRQLKRLSHQTLLLEYIHQNTSKESLPAIVASKRPSQRDPLNETISSKQLLTNHSRRIVYTRQLIGISINQEASETYSEALDIHTLQHWPPRIQRCRTANTPSIHVV